VAHPQIAAFARLANGSASPLRSIAGQNTLMARRVHDMGYDPVRDEIVVMQPRLSAVMTYRGDADGDVSPIRKIMGPKTQISGRSDRVSLDAVHHEYFVPNGNKVLVFPQEADGDVAPLRVLEGPDNAPMWARAITIDPVHNLLIVSGRNPAWGTSIYGESDRIIEEISGKRGTLKAGSIPALFIPPAGANGLRGSLEGGSIGHMSIFERTASGNTKPLRVITGSKTLLSSDQFMMATYPTRGWIVGAVWGTDYGEEGGWFSSPKSFVGVWSINDQGDAPPRWTLGGPNGILRQVHGLTLDPKHKTVIVTDKHLNAVLSFEFPEIF
jgi:hypothetical protein